jgi:hypothetical protein
VRYKRSVIDEFEAAIAQPELDKKQIECFVLNDSDFYKAIKELGASAGMSAASYDKMSNSYNLKYKDIPILKKG